MTTYKASYEMSFFYTRGFRQMLNRWCFELDLELNLQSNGGFLIKEYFITVKGLDACVQEFKQRLHSLEQSMNEPLTTNES